MFSDQKIMTTTISMLKRVAVTLLCLLAWATVSTAKTYVVEMMDAPPYFNPVKVEVGVGDTVIWKNTGPKMFHIVMNENTSLFSQDIQVGKEWSNTFKQAGVYPYICFRHFFMRGTVVVRNPDGTTDSALEFPYQAAFKEFVVPTPQGIPRMIIASKKEHAMWFTEGGGDFYGFEDIPPQNKLARIDDTGRIVEYATPTPTGDGSKVGVDSLVMDRAGNVWFTERLTNRIGRLDPSGTIREFQIPTKDGYALGVDIDSKGNIWFAERYGNRIGWMTPQGQFTEIELPDKESEPRTVFVDSHDRVWYTTRVANQIGYYDIATKKLVILQIPTKEARAAGIGELSDGTIYFVEMVGNKVAKVVNDQIVEYLIPTKFSAPFKIAADAQDNLWFTQVYGSSISKFEPKTGNFTEYKIPTQDSRPGGIAVDYKGRIWFTEQKGNKIGMFDPTQAQALNKQAAQAAQTHPEHLTLAASVNSPLMPLSIEDFKIPTPGAFPGNELVEDSEGWLWFIEMFGNKIGAIDLRTQKFREIDLPTVLSMPDGLARDAEGNFWVTQFRGNRLARLDGKSGAVTEYHVPLEGSLPAGVTVDEKGDVWLALLGANRILRFNKQTNGFDQFELPRPESGPLQVVSDKKGSLWVTASEERANYLARFDLGTRHFEVFEMPTPNASPVGMLVDGAAIWVAEGGAGKLARFDTRSRSWEEFAIPAEKSEPVKLAKDASGRIWLTDGGGLGSSGGNRLVVFDPRLKTFELIPMKVRGAKPMGIIASSDGNIWFTQQGANRISRVSLKGTGNGTF
jgi:streptogramin lyase/plastocyanin